MKVLVCGDVKGKIEALYGRVRDIFSKKAGSFDILLCVGDFSSAALESELIPYINEEVRPPVPTYFFEPGDSPALAAKLSEHDTDAVEIAKDIFYLGRGGIKTVNKLTIAFLARDHTRQDLEKIKQISERPYFIGSDVLLTTDWPQGAEVDLPPASFEDLASLGVHVAAVGNADNTDAALAARPRYHFVGSRDVFFQRAPYRLPLPPHSAGAKSVHHTRFIALGIVGNADKRRKWMHALGIEPVTHLAADVLSAEPEGATECPYVARRVLAGDGKRPGAAAGGAGSAGVKRPRNEDWAAKIAQEEGAKRSDTGMFFFANRGGRGGGGRGQQQPGGFSNEPVDPTVTGVFVGNLANPAITTADLAKLFSTVGPLEGEPNIVQGKAFGFVEFKRHDDAQRAVQTLNGCDFMGAQIIVNWKKGRRREGPAGGGGGGGGGGPGSYGPGGAGPTREEAAADPENTTVHVGNLNKEHMPTPQEIREAFVLAGCNVADMLDIRVREQRACAFVEFSTHAAAAAAIAKCDNTPLGRATMRCNWGRSTASAGDSGAGGRGASGEKAASQQYPSDPRQACWFCLASPELEDHLVVSIAEHTYLALPKGALTPDHVLIVPVAHTSRYSELTAEAAAEVERYKAALRAYFASKQQEALVFERCVRTQGANHLHLQVLPVPRGELAVGARVLLTVEGQRFNLSFTEVPFDADLREVLGPAKAPQYFYAELPADAPGSCVRRLAVVPADEPGDGEGARGQRRSVPLQFGRGVAAKLLGRPELAHWKAVAASKDDETRAADAFKAAFAPFDISA